MKKRSKPLCRLCGQPIELKKTAAENWLPVNPKPEYYYPDPNGNATMLTKDGRLIRGIVGQDYIDTAEEGDPIYIGYVVHWSTCPKVERHFK